MGPDITYLDGTDYLLNLAATVLFSMANTENQTLMEWELVLKSKSI